MIHPSFSFLARPERPMPLGLTFSRSSSGTRVNRNGLIELISDNNPRHDYHPITGEYLGILREPTRTNMIIRSSEFSDSAWIKYGVSVTSNAIIAPDGTLTASKLIEDTSLSSHSCSQVYAPAGSVSGTYYSGSIFIKAGERTRASLVLGPNAAFTNESTLNVDLANGTISYTAADPYDWGMEPLKDGWYRIWMSNDATLGSQNLLLRIHLVNDEGNTHYTGDGTSGLYIWGADAGEGVGLTSYIPTTTAPVTRDGESIISQSGSDWINSEQGSFVFTGITRELHPTASVSLVILNDETANNQVMARISSLPGVNGCDFLVIRDSANQVDTASFSIVKGDQLTVSAGYKKDDFEVSVNGEPVKTDLSGLAPVNLNKLILGGVLFNGYIKRFVYYPRKMDNVTLQKLSANY